MIDRFTHMVTHDVQLDFARHEGVLNLSSHSTGIGGVHPMPMPAQVIEGIKQLQPKLIRIFIQEFFFIYNDDGTFNWSSLDEYMAAVHATGAKIMASICIKPHAMYPEVDETVWMPNDVQKWQYVISELANRYSVERDWVSHWAIANEMNIGETGGCPYKITSPDDFFEYYRLTLEPLVSTVPQCRLGGPSYAGGGRGAAEYLGRFAQLCHENNVRLDFVAYNEYGDDPKAHAASAIGVKAAVSRYFKAADVFITELNIGICNEISIDEKAFTSKRAASLTATVLALNETHALAGTFQYHAYDQYCDPRLFKPFYAIHRFMANHWNDEPHRAGLFTLTGEPKPQYFAYKFMHRLASERVHVECTGDSLSIVAAQDGDARSTILAVNYAVDGCKDALLHFHAASMPEGIYRMRVTRIDDARRETGLEIEPTEDRTTYIHPDFHFAVYMPADSVALIEFMRAE